MNDLQNTLTSTEPKQPEPVAQVFGRPLSPLARLFRAVRRALFGHEFTCWHMDADGDVKVFHCKTFADAMAWVDCALNDSRVWVIDRRGSLVAVRHPVCSPRHDLYVRRAGAKPAAESCPDCTPPQALADVLNAVTQAVRDYHFALDTRQHGGVAAGKSLDAIPQAIGLKWVQGAEASARAAIAKAIGA